MPKLAVSDQVMRDVAALPKHIGQKVADAVAKFQQQTHAGMHKEKIAGALDPRVRTIRIDLAYRGIVLAPETGDSFFLMRVMNHDDAYEWIGRNKFGVNAATGAIEVFDLVNAAQATSQATPPGEAVAGAVIKPLFEGFSDKTLMDLGIHPDAMPIVRQVTSEDHLLSLASILPIGQSDVLLQLAEGHSPEDVWAQLVGTTPVGPIDVDDFDAALEREITSSTFVQVNGTEELIDVLSKPFDVWRVFLHPTQRRIAYRPVYPKPVRVTGGAGTGKTVVALHRAKALADSLPPEQPILFTTFTRNLTNVIQRHLELLGGKTLRARITVNNVDRIATQIVRDVEGGKPSVLFEDEERRLWREAIDRSGAVADVDFMRREWEQVILSQAITTRDEYLRAARPGRGSRLDRRQRMSVWAAVEAFGDLQRHAGKRTFLQMSVDAAGYLQSRSVRPFAAVIVDEAQDLHPAQWRLLRALVAEGDNDMFIVGDAFQRIYGNRTTLSKVGINVVGRSFKLKLNYRTTHEILSWARALLDGVEADDLDGGADTLDGYRSLLRGGSPRFTGCTSSAAEMTHICNWVQELVSQGFEHREVGIAARTRATCENIEKALRSAGIPVHLLDGNDDGPPDSVSVGTMHRLKGLEFRAMAVADCSRWSVPLSAAIVPENIDSKEHARSIQTERSLLFVASTRARDELSVSWSGQPSEFLTATGVTG